MKVLKICSCLLIAMVCMTASPVKAASEITLSEGKDRANDLYIVMKTADTIKDGTKIYLKINDGRSINYTSVSVGAKSQNLYLAHDLLKSGENTVSVWLEDSEGKSAAQTITVSSSKGTNTGTSNSGSGKEATTDDEKILIQELLHQ